MNGFQISLIVLGVLAVFSLVWVELKGRPSRARNRSALVDQAGVESNARTSSQGTWLS